MGRAFACKTLISHLNEMISDVSYALEHRDSVSKIKQNNFASVSYDRKCYQKVKMNYKIFTIYQKINLDGGKCSVKLNFKIKMTAAKNNS